MTKPIEQYTADELSEKIKAIKAERERTANALKKYEEELERRKQEVPLGVPCGHEFNRFNSFLSKESAEKHDEMLLVWRKALIANSKGEPIDIKVLLPLLLKGFVCCQKSGVWCWFEDKPELRENWWFSTTGCICITTFNIKPAENWENSLQECGL